MYKSITIFTPTYNRAHLLSNLFDSLSKQEYYDFVWLIVDDGSTDNTRENVENFKNMTKFPIHYIYQKNQGKHVAINTAIKVVDTEFFMIVDSDDILLPNFSEKIKYWKNKMTNDIIALAFPIIDNNNNLLLSNNFNIPIISTPIEMSSQYDIGGEFTLFFKAKLIKQYLYPVFENEKFLRESIVFNRMALKFKFLYIPDSVVKAEYQSEGLTKNIRNNLYNSPIGSTLAFKELMNSPNLTIEKRLDAAMSFWDYATYCNQSFFKKIFQINGINLKIRFLYRKFIK